MVTALNILATVALLLVVLLRDAFRDAFVKIEKQEPRDYSTLRLLLGPTIVVLVVLVAVATWALVDAGLVAPALLLIVHVAFLLSLAWSRKPNDCK